MTRITLDQAIISQLLQEQGSVEICDQHGNSVGLFRPTPPAFDLSKERGLSEEEVQRRLKLPRRPLTEILAELEKIK
jgi:hypothetical protein